MRLAVYLVPLILPALGALLARPLSERLHPRAAAWALTLSALVLAGGSWVVLGVFALAGLARIPLVAALGHWSARVVQQGDPASLTEAVAAGALLTAAVVAAVRMVWRRLRALVAAGLDAACMPGSDQLAVVEDPAPDAFALPGLPGRIVVSTGMLDALESDEQEVLLAHERSHLRAHHYAFVAAAQLAATANPLLRPIATAVTYTIERWADEYAAMVCGDRRRVARTVGKAALATKHTPARGRLPLAALGLLGRRDPLRTAGPVPRRVAALLASPLRVPLLPLVGVAAILTASMLCAFDAAHDLHSLIEVAEAG
ncbi:M56 family metallopeptidase [Streptomyces silvisoli]|uniref:M56 family metallopeptidase n=1 Tax=Streptomyces silvisoli TaxID=3034235 RepID=A0ABT5ZPW1_9ACTN|nr:M56 family metallopeptidase [Streptomyces silvisoli]MDF3291609.1 M56 family metallopeptidase [Streptomyces silvisoli]